MRNRIRPVNFEKKKTAEVNKVKINVKKWDGKEARAGG